MKKRTKNSADNFIFWGLLIALLCAGPYLGYLIFFEGYPVAKSVEIPVIPVRDIPVEQPKEPITLDYDYAAIQEEVMSLTKEYFYFKDKYNLDIQNAELGSEGKIILLGRWRFITNGITGVEIISIGTKYTVNRSDIYRLVFVHEYTHHVLFMLMTNSDEDEALAEAFTWYVDRKTSTELFGEDNSGHGSASYQIVITPILTSNNLDCLDKVFVKTNKIKNVEDYKRRLRFYCNSTI